MNRSSATEINLYSYNLEGRLATAGGDDGKLEMDCREIKNGALAQRGECRSLGLMKLICTYSSLTPLGIGL